MGKLREGLYEQVINKEIGEELAGIQQDYYISDNTMDTEEASKILADYVAEVIRRGLNSVKEKAGEQEGEESLQLQVEAANELIAKLNSLATVDCQNYLIETEGKQLLSLYKKQNTVEHITNKTSKKPLRPETSIAQSSLFTGAENEPQLHSELKREIATCDRVDMLVSFIKWSGLRMIIEPLREFTQQGGQLRIITTTYMGATDYKAIEEIAKLPNTEIKISYNSQNTRLHAKSYIFHRSTGFSTAYIGSSNISNPALTSGLEWNIKISKVDQMATMEKIEGSFETYWNSKEFETYTFQQQEKLQNRLLSERGGKGTGTGPRYFFDLIPYAYQQEVLDKLKAEREIRGNYKNLIVAATGVGKTMIAAFDYKNYRQNNPGSKCRMLFVAHRKEILLQSLETFRAVLKDQNFGELCVDNFNPSSIDHLFVSVQSFNSKEFANKIASDFFDYLVIDEFHHAAARSYGDLLYYLQPKILMGLTATPERMDGKHNKLYEIFNNYITAEIRLPEAIERKLLCPFQYFGVTDTVDLSKVRWTSRGYDKKELENIYTIAAGYAQKRAQYVVEQVIKYVNDVEEVKGLGFCVSIEHAKFMSNFFNDCGIKAISLSSESSGEERSAAKEQLRTGSIKFIFVVDLYNEGVDIPEINTVLFLRPTESLTIFLQQLGRGLRLSPGKDYLTVLDFIGQANDKYNYADKFAALLADPNGDVKEQINEGFTRIPKGCYIALERKAKEFVLANINKSISNNINTLYAKIRGLKEQRETISLTNYLRHYPKDLNSIYSRGSFARLCVGAGVKEDFQEEMEQYLGDNKKNLALKKLLLTNSRGFITLILSILTGARSLAGEFSLEEWGYINLFNVTIYPNEYNTGSLVNSTKPLVDLINSPIMCGETVELLNYMYSKIDFVDLAMDLDFACPIKVYCQYTKDQILAGFDFVKTASMREGTKYLPDKKVDLLFVTLNKSAKHYSPTTMYQDYSINETLFHWQSQSTTSETSPTGQRYIKHRSTGHKIILFVREDKQNKNLNNMANPYTCLGIAKYIKHEGSNPMSIVWELAVEIPAKFINKTNKFVSK